MNWRAVGCLVIGVAVFVGIGLLGMSFAFRAQPGCPPGLQWADRIYTAQGTPAPSPAFATSGDSRPHRLDLLRPDHAPDVRAAGQLALGRSG